MKKKTRAIDITKLCNPFWNTNLFLATTKGMRRKVVGVGHTMEQAIENAKRSGCDDPIIMKSPGDAMLHVRI